MKILRLLLASVAAVFMQVATAALVAAQCDSRSINIPIGGIFKSETTASYFREVLGSLNRVMPQGYCLKPETLLLSREGSLRQLSMICDKLIPKGIFAFVLGDITGRRAVDAAKPIAPTFISTYYQTPMLSLVSRAPETITELEVHKRIIHLLPHKAHEVEVWCAIMTRFQLTHAIVILSNDVVGNEYESRLRNYWWRSRSIRYLKFVHVESQSADKNYFANMMTSIAYDQCRVILMYAEGSSAVSILREAKNLNMTTNEWTWIVSEFVLRAHNTFDGIIAAQLIVPTEAALINDALSILAYSMARSLNTTWYGERFQRNAPTKRCEAAEDNTWKGGLHIIELIRKSLYLNSSDQKLVVFDSMGYRKTSSYRILNKQPGKTSYVVVGFYNESVLKLENQMETFFQEYGLTQTGDPVSADDYGAYTTFTEFMDIGTRKIIHSNDAIIDRSKHSAQEAELEKDEKAKELLSGSQLGERQLTLQDNKIYWPGGGEAKSREFTTKWHIRVLTTESVPYVYVFKNPRNLPMIFSDPAAEDKVDNNRIVKSYASYYNKSNFSNFANFNEDVVYCPGLRCVLPPHKSNSTVDYCCYGYCIDLLVNLAEIANFTFDLYYSDEGFGHYEEPESEADSEETRRKKNGSRSDSGWTGMVNDLINNHADMIVAPLTVSPQRSRVIDFTKPFKYPTLNILMKRHTQKSNLGSFLQPFETSLWVLMFFTVNIIAIGMFLLERFSPFGWSRSLAKNRKKSSSTLGFHSSSVYKNSMSQFSKKAAESEKANLIRNPLENWFCKFCRPKNPADEQGETAVTLPQAVWLSWGIVLSTGPGENLPRSFSARVFTMIWAGLAMIIVSAYTANLAAYLVLDRPKDEIRGIDDPRLRNPSNSFRFSTVRNSDVELYFKRYVEFAALYRAMESRSFATPELAIDAVLNNSINAFIWESSRLQNEALNDCELTVTPESFGRSQYAIGLRKELKHNVYYDWRADLAFSTTKKALASNAYQGANGRMLSTINEESATMKGRSFLDTLSLVILQLLETGFLENLETKWTFTKLQDLQISKEIIDSRNNYVQKPLVDESDEEAPQKTCVVEIQEIRLSLQNIAGIFMLLIIGIAISGALLILEVAFYRRVRKARSR